MKFFAGFGKIGDKARRLAPLLAALALGILAAGLGWYYLRASEREIAASLERESESLRRDVVVPVRNLRAGQTITPDLVAKRSVPSEYVHADALSPETFVQFAGRQLTVDLAAGKPFLSSFFTSPRKVFAEEIEQGVRAITIPVDEISSISGMLRAGDRIDFFYVAEESGQTPQEQRSFVVPLLQDIEVRATGQITSEQFASMRKRPDVVASESDPYGRSQYSTVTVGLQPQDAQTLVLAQRRGKIVAALRNPDDRRTMRTGVDVSDLDAIVNTFRPPRMRPALPPVVRSSGPGVEYIIGGGRSQAPAGLSPVLAAAAAAAMGGQASLDSSN